MTFTQLEYAIAVDTHKHFAKAAEVCFVTQPTLSMQIQKLEDELGILLFDRSKQPVITTENGKVIIEQARKIIAEKEVLHDLVSFKKGIIAGELKLGIIPTLAPYLLPLFINSFTQNHAQINLHVYELTTEQIIDKLKNGTLDVGILVTPLQEQGITEIPLFYEEMMVYVSPQNAVFKKNYLLPKDINPSQLWLLEEGHCFRSQIINLCSLREANLQNGHFSYEASSLETLKRMVNLYNGITILPELAVLDLDSKQKRQIKRFKNPVPVREVSLAVHRNFAKKRMIDVLKKEILQALPKQLNKTKKKQIVSINV